MKKFLICFFCTICLCACSSVGSTSSSNYETSTADYSQDVTGTGSTTASKDQVIISDSGQKMITSGHLSIEAQDMQASVDALQTLLTKYQGKISYRYTSGQGTDDSLGQSIRQATYTVEIPSAQLDAFLSECGSLGNILETTISSEDVTSSYMDNDAHLESLLIQQKRLQDLIEKATNVSDIMDIQNALTDVEYQIESCQQTKTYYDSQIQYSSIDLYLTEVTDYTMHAPSFWDRLTSVFTNSWKTFGSFLENCLFLILFAAPYIAIGVVLFYFIGRRKKARTKAAKTISAPKIPS